MNWRHSVYFFCLLLCGCKHLSPQQRLDAIDIAQRQQQREIVSVPAVASPLRERAAQINKLSRPDAPRHLAMLLDRGPDALLARVHSIRSARHSIDLQTFIFELDDSGGLLLDELIAAARRGVRVRVLLDQLYGLPNPNLQAALSAFHRNFELRIYNPTFGEARTQRLQFAAGIICCFRRFNQRMHSKVLLVDDELAITGGRNVQDRYFDWNAGYNYRDRDVLIAGPVVASMQANFAAFWRSPRTVPAAQLVDVAQRLLLQQGGVLGALPNALRPRSPRVIAMAAMAADGAATWQALSGFALEVGRVDFFGDKPGKHEHPDPTQTGASKAMRDLVAETQHEVVMQTPYLVLSGAAKRVFKRLQKRAKPPRIWVSSNSLAATDAFPVYAMSHKYKRLYLRELAFNIFEYKPYPTDAPINVAATGALGPAFARLPMFGSGSAGSAHGPVPLRRAGVRVGLHAKSMTIDDRIAVIGSHNFDPRSDELNTESLLVIHDAGFAQALEASIRRDMQPENAWLIAAKPKPPVLWGLSYSLGKLSEKLPVFDLWPVPYAVSYELKPGCMPLPPNDPGFAACYQQVGAFPEVDMKSKAIYTRILTVFGAGLVPIL